MKRLWWIFFLMIWPVLALVVCAMTPGLKWGFPGDGLSDSTIGVEIDHLFYVILIICTIVFIGTQVAIGYVLWTASSKPADRRAWYSHGNHKLEMIWTILPGIVLLFLALYQTRTWAEFRMNSAYPEAAKTNIIAEVNARQFEWRMRYPAPGKSLERKPQIDDMYQVNELHVPSGTPVTIQLRTQDVQHSFFLPTMRIKQDAVPGMIIPVWFEAKEPGEYPLVCAELCGWGHYKMGAKVIAHPPAEYDAYMKSLQEEQFDDGYVE